MFIRDKYIQHRFVAKTCVRSANTDDRPYELQCAIEGGELIGVVQMFGEDADFGLPLPGMVRCSSVVEMCLNLIRLPGMVKCSSVY